MKTLMMFAAAAAAAPVPKPALAPSEIVAAAPKADWVAIAASDLLVMDLASGKRVVIQLMPPPFSQGWVGNIRKLAAARWWDGTSINRVQDNYVVQWGDATEKKALPKGLAKVPESEYYWFTQQTISIPGHSVEYSDPPSLTLESGREPYAYTGFYEGWPNGTNHVTTWPVPVSGGIPRPTPTMP